jgi:hypothetical protein
MAVSTVLCGRETSVNNDQNFSRIQAVEMKLFKVTRFMQD